MPVEWLDEDETQSGGVEWLDDEESSGPAELLNSPFARGIPAMSPTAGIVTDISQPPSLTPGPLSRQNPFTGEAQPFSPEDRQQGERLVELDRLQRGERDVLEPGGIGSQAGIGAELILPTIGEQAWGALAGAASLAENVPTGAVPGVDFMRSLRPLFEERMQSKAEDVRNLGTIGRATGGPEIVRETVQGIGSMAPALAAGPAGFPAMVAAAGLQSYGAGFSEAKQAGLSDSDAQQDALIKGAITAVVTAGFGKTGVESLLNPTARSSMRSAITDIFKQAGFEATEESTDEALSTVYDTMRRQPNMDLADAVTRVFKAGVLGGVLGGGVATVSQARQGLTDPQQQSIATLPQGQSALQGAPLTETEPFTPYKVYDSTLRFYEDLNRIGKDLGKKPDQEKIASVKQWKEDLASGKAVLDKGNPPISDKITTPKYREALQALRDRPVNPDDPAGYLDSIKNVTPPPPTQVEDQPVQGAPEPTTKSAPVSAPLVIQLTATETRGQEVTPEIKDFETRFTDGSLKTTNEAVKSGLAAKSISDLEALAKLGEQAREKSDALQAQAESETDPDKKDELLYKAMLSNVQLPREAVEAATNTGSHVEGELDTAFDLGERPLDWRNNQEVAEWLKKNGSRLQIALPDELQSSSQAQPTTTPNEATQETKEERVLTPEAMSEIERDYDAAQAAKPVGVGAAVPSEFEPEPSGPTSIKNATVDKERAARGLPPAVQAARRSFGEVWDRAMAVADNDPTAQDKLISELKSKPRALTDLEDALLLQRQVELQNEFAKATRDLAQAHEDGRPEDVLREQERVDFLSDKLLELYDVGKAAGTETGRGLSARRMMANEDFTLAAMEVQARAAKGGRQLTPEESEQLGKTQKKIQKTQEALDSHLDNSGDKAAKQIIDKVSKEFLDSAVDPFEQQEVVTAQLRAKLDSGDFDISNLVQRLARLFVATGITKRDSLISAVHGVLVELIPDLTIRDTMDAISGYGRFKPLSKDDVSTTLRDLKGQMQQVAKLEDIEARKPLKKTGVERRSPSDEERRLIQQVNEAKRKYGVVVTDPATQLRSALQSAKTFLTHRLADLRQEISTRERIVKTKTPLKPDAELEALRAEYETVKKEHAAIFPRREITDAQRIELANRALDRSIAKLESDLDAGKLKSDKPVNKTPDTPGLLEKRAWLEALRQHRKELLDAQKPKLTPEERALQSLKSRLTRSIAEYQRRLRVGDFTPKSKTAVDISKDPEAIKLKAENERLKAEFRRGLEIDRLKRRTRGQKIYAGTKEVLNLARNIWTSFDLSAVFRQGGFLGVGNPARAAKAIMPMLNSLKSEQDFLELEQQILNRPNAPLYARSKLYLAPSDSIKMSPQEEQIMSRLGNKIPGVRASNRAFMGYLNKLRADSFDALVESRRNPDSVAKMLGLKSGEPTQEELNAISNFINVATGRGNMGKAAGAAEFLATIFFSPRLLLSRFQLLAGQPLYRGSAHTRYLIAKEYAKSLSGVAVLFGLGALAGGDLEDDPRSADFGKIRFGNTRVDPLAGLAQVTVLLSRLGAHAMNSFGKEMPVTKTGAGELKFRDEPLVPSAPEAVGRFLRTKLSPVLSTAGDLVGGENVVGEEVTLGTTFLPKAKPPYLPDIATPLSFKDIYDVMQDQGVARGTALEILSLFGMGLQHYDDQP